MRTLVLASSSRYRAGLLTRLGLDFRQDSPDVDEARLPGEAPDRLVVRLARRKAQVVAERHAGALCIGSDQVAVCDDLVLGKPGTAERAREQLARLSGRSVRFLTGLSLYDGADGRDQHAMVATVVRFRPLTAHQIADYVAREQPLDCAGAFKSEGLGIALFEAVESADPTALIGLPLITLCGMLANIGLPVVGRAVD